MIRRLWSLVRWILFGTPVEWGPKVSFDWGKAFLEGFEKARRRHEEELRRLQTDPVYRAQKEAEAEALFQEMWRRRLERERRERAAKAE